MSARGATSLRMGREIGGRGVWVDERLGRHFERTTAARRQRACAQPRANNVAKLRAITPPGSRSTRFESQCGNVARRFRGNYEPPGPRSCARMGVSRLRRTVRAPARANPAAEVRALSEDFSAHPPFESSHSVPSVVKSPRRAARKPRRLRFHSQRFSTVSTASWGVSSGPSQDGWIAFFA